MLIKDCCKIVSEKISTDGLNLQTYISTENMLNGFSGVFTATSLPKTKVTGFCMSDILISNIRPYFKKTWFADFDGGCSTDVINLRVNSPNFLPKFIYYNLTSDRFVDEFVASCKGTKMPRGDKDVLLNYKINPLSLATQQHIVNLMVNLRFS